MNTEKYLPIGTVVLLKDATKKLMIIGYCSIGNSNENKVYDYSGCLYPEGLLKSDEVALFNHNQINSIYFMGYSDEEQIKFSKFIKEEMNNENAFEKYSSDKEEK